MNLRKDLKTHLIGGTAVALFLLLQVIIPRLIGPGGHGIAVMFGSVVVGLALEEYQRIRKEGTWDWRDLICTSAPGVALGFGVALWEVLR